MKLSALLTCFYFCILSHANSQSFSFLPITSSTGCSSGSFSLEQSIEVTGINVTGYWGSGFNYKLVFTVSNSVVSGTAPASDFYNFKVDFYTSNANAASNINKTLSSVNMGTSSYSAETYNATYNGTVSGITGTGLITSAAIIGQLGYSSATITLEGLCIPSQTISAGNAPLPVHLVSFTSIKNGNVVGLKWTTASEKGFKQYEIEKSTDTKLWQQIAVVPGKGTESDTEHLYRNYEFTDIAPATGNNYYRLKMVDLDNTFSYSTVSMIYFNDLASDKGLYVYPNPAEDIIYISQLNSTDVVKIYNLTGQEVLSFSPASEITGSHPINIESLNTGTYILCIYDSNYKMAGKMKILIQK